MKIVMAEMRIKLGLKQSELGKLVGVKTSMISMMECGQRVPTYKVLCKLEDVFQTSHRILFSISQNPKENQV